MFETACLTIRHFQPEDWKEFGHWQYLKKTMNLQIVIIADRLLKMKLRYDAAFSYRQRYVGT